MSARLREELQRLGDRAPVARVPDDTWSRAARARRRDRSLLVAATVVVLALLGGTVAWLPREPPPPVAGGGSLGVPDRLHAVPERMLARGNDGSWMRREVTGRLAVGLAAAAWVTDAGLPVVVDAARGDYHLLDLPDFGGNNSLVARGIAPPALALSPDGRQLAYSYASFGPDSATEPIPSGIRVLDLTTGELRSVEVTAGEGTAVTAIAWSPDSSWLAWSGMITGFWTEHSIGGGRPTGGRVAPGASRSERLRIADHETATIAVTDAGEVWEAGSDSLLRWEADGRTARSPVPDSYWRRQAVMTDDGIAIGAQDGLQVAVIDRRGRTTLRQANGDLPTVGGGSADVLGTVGDDLLVRTRGLDDTDGQLLLVPEDGEARVVGTVEAGVPDSLTVAVDLMTLEHPTLARPAPDWPWSDERRAVVIGTAALVLLAVGWLSVTLVRRRRP